MAQWYTPKELEPYLGTHVIIEFNTVLSPFEIKGLLEVPKFVLAWQAPRDDCQGFRCTNCDHVLTWPYPIMPVK